MKRKIKGMRDRIAELERMDWWGMEEMAEHRELCARLVKMNKRTK